MEAVLKTIGTLLLVFIIVVLIILWQRVQYELRFRKHETWTLDLWIDWIWRQTKIHVRYAGGAGLFWEVKWPFGGMNSYPKHTAEMTADPPAEQEMYVPTEVTDEQAAAAEEARWAEIEAKSEANQKAAEAAAKKEQPAEKEDEQTKAKPGAVDYIRLVRYALAQGIIDDTGTYLARLWGRTKPRYAEGAARIGLADAYTQGLLMGGLYSTLPAIAARIDFVFTEEIMEGYFRFGGGARPLALLWDTIRFIAAPSVRKSAWYYWRHVRK